MNQSKTCDPVSTSTCLKTTDCIAGDENIKCPDYSYWEITSPNRNLFNKNCKQAGYNAANKCKFWSNSNKSLNIDDAQYVTTFKDDVSRCKQLQTYALNGEWDKITNRLKNSTNCANNKNQYVAQIKYLLCQLQNCRTKFYDKIIATPDTNPFNWNTKEWGKNWVRIVSAIITAYFLGIGTVTSLFQIKDFKYGLKIINSISEVSKNTKESIGVIVVSLLLIFSISRIIMWITSFLRTDISTHPKNTHTIGDESHTVGDETASDFETLDTDPDPTGKTWLYTLLITITMVAYIILIGAIAKTDNKGIKIISGILLLIGIILFITVFLMSTIVPVSLFNTSGPNSLNTAINIQYTPQCDTARQVRIGSAPWSHGLWQIFIIVCLIFFLTCFFRHNLSKIKNIGFFKKCILLAIMPFTLILIPLVIFLNWYLAGIFIEAYPILMICQRMVVGISRYYFHKFAAPGFDKYDDDELLLYLDNRNLGWPLLFMPIVKGVISHIQKISDKNNKPGKNKNQLDITSNQILFGNIGGISGLGTYFNKIKEYLFN